MTVLAGTVARNLKTWNADSFEVRFQCCDFDILHVISNINYYCLMSDGHLHEAIQNNELC